MDMKKKRNEIKRKEETNEGRELRNKKGANEEEK